MPIASALVFVMAVMTCALAGPAGAQALDKVSFGTNWVAEAEHGGFYQALADGTYREYGLDVTIVPGGPLINNRILLPVGRLDFFMSANTLQSFDAVARNIPTLAVAAMFQKDPQVLIAHPGQGIDTFEDLKKLTLFISKEGLASYFQWLKADFGFSEARVKPYTSNPQPFLADKRSAMQGYVTSEPFAIEKQAGFQPKVFLSADQGFAARFYRALCVFLADRLRHTTRRMGYGNAADDADAIDAMDELNENLLETVHLAGARFDRMLKRLAG